MGYGRHLRPENRRAWVCSPCHGGRWATSPARQSVGFAMNAGESSPMHGDSTAREMTAQPSLFSPRFLFGCCKFLFAHVKASLNGVPKNNLQVGPGG